MSTSNTMDGQSIVIAAGQDQISINLRQNSNEIRQNIFLNSILIEIGDLEIEIRRNKKTHEKLRNRDSISIGGVKMSNEEQTSKKQINQTNNKTNKYWDYSPNYGPHVWSQIFPEIQFKKFQSPIRIYSEQTEFDPDLAHRPLIIEFDENSCQTLENTGRSFQVSGKANSHITGGPVHDDYKFLQFHMHWGANELEGSEHVLDGVRYPAELHIVTWNTTRYQTAQAAAASNDFDGLMVFGILIKITSTDNPDFAPLLDLLSKIIHSGDKIDLEQNVVSLKNLFPRNITQYYSYNGSLTTPTCAESVRWVVFRERIGLSRHQIDQLRQLKCSCREQSTQENNILENFRPVMPLNGRIVFRSFK